MKQRNSRVILATAVALLMALFTGGAVYAAADAVPNDGPSIPVPDAGEQAAPSAAFASNCKETRTNGAGLANFDYCWSDDGNLVMLEHSEGLEHIRAGAFLEGWCVSANGTKRGETDGANANIGLTAPIYPNASKVQHDTTDGALRVETRFGQNNGNKQVIMTMKVRNIGPVALNSVRLTRFVDADMDSTAGDDDFIAASRSVAAFQTGNSRLELVPLTTAFGANSMVFDTFDPALDGNCYNAAADTRDTFSGDGSMGVLYQLGTLLPGEVKTVKYTYRVSV